MLYQEYKKLNNNLVFKVIFLTIALTLIGSILFVPLSSENNAYRLSLASENYKESEYLLKQYENKLTFSKEIKSKIENEKSKLEISIFNTPNEIALINDAISLYEYIDSLNYELLPTMAINQVINSKLIMYSIILAVIVSFIYIYNEDILQNNYKMYKPTVKSLKNIFLNKFLLLASYLLVLFLIYISSILIMSLIDGFNILSPLQLLHNYQFVNSKMSLLIFLVYKFFIVMSIGLFLSFLSLILLLKFKEPLVAYGPLIIFVVVEYLLYNLVSLNDRLFYLKKYNLFYFLDSGLNSFNRIMFRDWIFDSTTLYIVLAGTLVFSMIVIAGVYYVNQKDTVRTKRLNNLNIFTNSLFLYEIFKIFINKKAMFIFIILTVFSYSRYSTYEVSISEGEIEYKTFEKDYYGYVDEKTLNEVAFVLEKAEEARDKLGECSKINCELSVESRTELMEHANQFGKYSQLYDRLYSAFQSNSKMFIDDEGYKYLIGDESFFSNSLYFLIISLMISLIVSSNVSEDYRMKLINIYNSTKNGKKKKNQYDLAIFYLSVILLMMIVYWFDYQKLRKGFPLPIYNVHLSSVIQGTSSTLDISQFILISYLGKFLVYVLIANLAYLVSKYVDVILTLMFVVLFALFLLLLYYFFPRFSPFMLFTISLVKFPVITFLQYIVLLIINYWSIKRIILNK